MGAPDEYFNYRGQMLQMVARLQPGYIRHYVGRLLAVRTSPNGVFGFKAHWNHFKLVIDGELLAFFPGLRYIYIERTDRLSQAVSYARAKQTRQWVSGTRIRRTPDYDPKLIQVCLTRIQEEHEKWNTLFRRHGVQPIRVKCESLVENPQTIVDDILRQFGLVRDPSQHVDVPPTERQSDPINQDWIERFRREGGDRGQGL